MKGRVSRRGFLQTAAVSADATPAPARREEFLRDFAARLTRCN